MGIFISLHVLSPNKTYSNFPNPNSHILFPFFFSFQFNNHFEFLLALVRLAIQGLFKVLAEIPTLSSGGLAEVNIGRSSRRAGISSCFLRALGIIISYFEGLSGRCHFLFSKSLCVSVTQ